MKEVNWESFDAFLQNLASKKGANLISSRIDEITWKNGKPEVKTEEGFSGTYDLLTIATGDTNSLWARLNGSRWTFYNPPQHIFCFNQENIKRILGECGFKIVRTAKNGKWLSLRYVLHLARTVGESKFAESLYWKVKDNLLGKIPLYLRLNDNMVVFAVKNS